ncbi:hypothetical protein [Pseudomonas sp. GW101-3H06]|uniref:hypothetical protein n=1 Tax=Pseudomonas sp. GW101-3H06 TaxID=2751347 RepID=UPI001A931718|nr:hypothetical protein [Pseudomonas sp. GW101-3H06]
MHKHRIFELFSMEEHETHDELWSNCLFKVPRFFASKGKLESTPDFSIKTSDSELTGEITYHGYGTQKNSKTIFRYPGIMEENVEDALIQLASKHCYNDNGFISVYFSLYELKNELSSTKKTYSIREIRLALNVLFETSVQFRGTFQGQRYENTTYKAFAHLSIRDSTSESREIKSSVKFSKFTSARILSGETERLNYQKATTMGALAKHIYKFLVRFHKEITNQKLVLSATNLINSSPIKLSERKPENTRIIKDALTQLHDHQIIETWSYDYSQNSDQISLRIINDSFIRESQA